MSKKLFTVRPANKATHKHAPTFESKTEAKAHRRGLNPVGLDEDNNEVEVMVYVVTYGPDHHRFVA